MNHICRALIQFCFGIVYLTLLICLLEYRNSREYEKYVKFNCAAYYCGLFRPEAVRVRAFLSSANIHIYKQDV